MKKNLVAIGVLSGVLAVALMFPKTSSAFWPFDKWFSNGEVKGEQTETQTTDAFGQTVKGVVTGKTEIEDSFSEEALTKAVKGKKISEAQRKRLLAKLAIIRAKRLELKKLQDAFIIWMKENRIDPKDFAKITATPSGTPVKNKQIKTRSTTKPTATPTETLTVESLQ